MVRLGRAIRAQWIERRRMHRGPGAGSAAGRVTTGGVSFGTRVRTAMRALHQAFFADDEQRAAAAWDLAVGACILIAVVVATW